MAMIEGQHVQLLAQAVTLSCLLIWTVLKMCLYVPIAVCTILLRVLGSSLGRFWSGLPLIGDNALMENAWLKFRSLDGQVTFYRGQVMHSRLRPAKNAFVYPVRMAYINLDDLPNWFEPQKADILKADEARSMANTKGSVYVLTNPPSVGYIQNPISVYYCYEPTKEDEEQLHVCIAEVTNTPWGERVRFLFRPRGIDGNGEVVAKSLHVSPLMDMQNKWLIKAPKPSEELFLSVAASHPELGEYFVAQVNARIDKLCPHLPNEIASFECFLKYGFQPQRVAFWIYWQAVKLLWKGVPFYSPPEASMYRETATESSGHLPKISTTGCIFEWQPAKNWPWKSCE